MVLEEEGDQVEEEADEVAKQITLEGATNSMDSKVMGPHHSSMGPPTTAAGWLCRGRCSVPTVPRTWLWMRTAIAIPASIQLCQSRCMFSLLGSGRSCARGRAL